MEKKKQLEVWLTEGCIGIYCFLLMYYCGLNNWIRDCLQIGPSIFSIAALGFLVLKILFTKYEKKEMAMIVLGMGVAAMNLWATRDITVLTNVVVICSVKNVDMEKALRWMFWGGVAVTGLIIVTSLCGGMPPIALVQDFGREAGVETRYCLGFYHPNHLHWQVIHVLLLGVAAYYRRMDWKWLTMCVVINVGLYVLTVSRTGLLCGLLLCGMVLLYRMAENVVTTIVWKVIEFVGAVGVVAFSVLSAYLYDGSGILAKINQLLNNRIIIANRFVEAIEWNWWGSLEYSAITTENGYIRMLLGLGIVPCIVFIGLELLLLVWASHNEKKEVRVIVLLTLVYGFMEPIGFLKVFKNIAFLYVGMMLFPKKPEKLIGYSERIK